jgi:predicted dehydrogenase
MKRSFVIVGYGRIGKRHANHILNYGNLVAIVDSDETARNEANEEFGEAVKIFKSIIELKSLGLDMIDIVSICSPNGLHYEHANQAIELGLSVLVEKPITLRTKDAHKLIEKAEKFNARVFAVKQNRFNPPVQFLRNLIQEHKLGAIYSFQLNCFWNRNNDYYSTSNWKGTKKLDGGVLYTQFSHFIDLLIWMLGNIEVEYATINRLNKNRNIEIEDGGSCILNAVDHGCSGTMNYSINATSKNMEGSLLLIGENATIKIGGQYLNELEYFDFPGEELPILEIGNSANNYGTYVGSMSNHDKVYENLIDVLNNKGSINTSGIEASKTVTLIEQIYEKAKS